MAKLKKLLFFISVMKLESWMPQSTIGQNYSKLQRGASHSSYILLFFSSILYCHYLDVYSEVTFIAFPLPIFFSPVFFPSDFYFRKLGLRSWFHHTTLNPTRKKNLENSYLFYSRVWDQQLIADDLEMSPVKVKILVIPITRNGA